MTNEGYRQRQDEWERRERERHEATKETPYDPDDMKGRVPLGCTLIILLGALALVYGIYRYLKFYS